MVMTAIRSSLLAAIFLAHAPGPALHAQAPRLTHVSTFGCESCSGPSLFTRIQAISVGPAGEIIVADNSDPMIRVFDAGGRPAASFGRAGSGPGELRSPIALARHADRSFTVVDLGRRAVLRMDSSGSDRGITQLDGFPTAASFAPGGGMALVGITSATSPSLRLLRVAMDGRATEPLSIGAGEFPQRQMHDASGLSIALAADGSIAVGDGAGAYVVRRYSANGTYAGEIRRDVARVKRTPEEIQALAEARAGELTKMQQMTGRNLAAAVSTTGIPPERNYFNAYGLQFDERGRLWVRAERGAAGNTVFDVFDANGRFLGEVTVNRAVRDFSLGAGMLAGVTMNADSVAQVSVWRVELAARNDQYR
jgi:hypothetical protein